MAQQCQLKVISSGRLLRNVWKVAWAKTYYRHYFFHRQVLSKHNISEGSICKWMSTIAVAPPNAFGVALWNSSKEHFVGNCNISTISYFSCSWHVCMELAKPKWVVLQWHYYRRGIFCLSHDINLIFNGGSKGWTLINPKLMNMTALHQLDFQ